jgi:hypothetical protein
MGRPMRIFAREPADGPPDPTDIPVPHTDISVRAVHPKQGGLWPTLAPSGLRLRAARV